MKRVKKCRVCGAEYVSYDYEVRLEPDMCERCEREEWKDVAKGGQA